MIPRRLKPIAEMSDAEWERAFPDEESCIEWLVNSRWPDEKRCPHCGSDLVFPASLREYRWRCFGCAPDLGNSFDYLSGTIFQDTLLPLRVWLKALHSELTGKRESQDAGELKMRRRIRDAMRDATFRSMVDQPSPLPAFARELDDPETHPDEVRTSCHAPSADLVP
jgi:hypothetical protein